MPRGRGDGPEHARAPRRAQEAAVRGLVADAVTEAHEAHTAAKHDPAGSARASLSEAVLPAIRALNGAEAPTLLLAMHRIVNAVQPGLISPEAALYGHWMEQRTSNRSGRPLSMGDTLQLMGAGSAMSLHSSTPALLHALRMRCPGDTAPYLNQVRATYPGGVSELDAALHFRHPPDADLEVGEITVFVEGADEAPTRPRPTNPVYDGARPTLPYAPTTRSGSPRVVTTRRSRGPRRSCQRSCPLWWLPLVLERGRDRFGLAQLRGACVAGGRAGHQVGSLGNASHMTHPQPTCTGQRPCPALPSPRPRCGTGYTPSCEHRRSLPLRGSTWCGSPRHHPMTPGGPGPGAPPQTGSCGATCGPRGSPTSRPSADGWPPAPARTGPTPLPAPPLPSPSPGKHCTALPTADHRCTRR